MGWIFTNRRKEKGIQKRSTSWGASFFARGLPRGLSPSPTNKQCRNRQPRWLPCRAQEKEKSGGRPPGPDGQPGESWGGQKKSYQAKGKVAGREEKGMEANWPRLESSIGTKEEGTKKLLTLVECPGRLKKGGILGLYPNRIAETHVKSPGPWASGKRGGAF